MDDYNYRFGGVGRLYGLSELEKLQRSHVCIVGIGGVGSWIAESLTRSGIGEITIVDLDDICITNVNRQLHALDGNIGSQKVDAMAIRMKLINPKIKVNAINDFLTASTIGSIFLRKYDYVVDAIDSIDNKCLLADYCKKTDISLLVIGGAGGKRDPSQIRISDLAHSENDKLLKRMKKTLKQYFGFEKGENIKLNIDCVYSQERAVFPGEDGIVCHTRDANSTLTLDCTSGFGTASHITGAFGFFATSQVIKRLIEKLD